MADLEMFRRRHLPHWDVAGATYFVTTCLEGSIPAQGRLDIEKYASTLAMRVRPIDRSPRDWQIDQWKLTFARTDRWLDLKPASRYLENSDMARIVVNSLYHFAGQRYDLLAFVVMPSHFHWVFRPRETWVATLTTEVDRRSPRERIMHSIKSYTANQCNLVLGRRGKFWQEESYDHWVRDDDELERIIQYVEQNPVKAGLIEVPELFQFSSAYDRRRGGLEFAKPLIRPQ